LRGLCAGTNIVAHEFFHAIHGVALKSMAPHVFTAIERAALRAVEEGIYQHHPVTTHRHTRNKHTARAYTDRQGAILCHSIVTVAR